MPNNPKCVSVAEPFGIGREDNAETVESGNTVLANRVWQYQQREVKERHRASLL
ncbi:hypothetical protein [Listeria welshimeri]